MGFRFLLLLNVLLWNACNQSNPTFVNESNTAVTEIPNDNISPSLVVEQDRYAWQKPDLVIDKLGNLDGKVVADIGAGTGYFTFRLMQSAEKVIAIDIDQDMINLIEIFRQNLDSINQIKVEPRIATPDNPNLKDEEVDIVVIINTIGYIEDRDQYLETLSKAMKDSAQLMIVDFKLKRIPSNIAPAIEYRVSLLEMEELLSKHGYEVIESDDRSLDYQYIVQAVKI